MTYTLPSWHPIQPRRNGLWQNAAAVTLIGFGVLAGTGGNVNTEQLLRHFGTGSASRPAYSRAAESIRGWAVELKSIRDALRLSVAETAQLFGVSRPTIYSWQNGSSISLENAERVRAIAYALTPHLHLLEEQVGRIAHRAVDGRTTLLQKLAAGGSAEEVVSQFAAILTRETTQRERLANRLRGRYGSRGSADLDTLG